MIPDRDGVAAFLRKFEQGIHRKGWDQPATYAEMSWEPGGMRTVPIKLPARCDVGEYLSFAAGILTSGTPLAVNIVKAMGEQRRFFGLVAVMESWGNDELTPDLDRSRTTRLADIVGSYEARELCATDIRGNVYGLHRRRGEKPIEWPIGMFTGRVPRSLRAMTRAIAEHLPPGRADLDALRRDDAIPSRDELEALWAANQPQR